MDGTARVVSHEEVDISELAQEMKLLSTEVKSLRTTMDEVSAEFRAYRRVCERALSIGEKGINLIFNRYTLLGIGAFILLGGALASQQSVALDIGDWHLSLGGVSGP